MTGMQLTADFFQQTSKVFTVSELTRSIRGTLEEVNEPYLIMEGYIKRTPQGRVATPNAYRKLGLKPPAGGQEQLL